MDWSNEEEDVLEANGDAGSRESSFEGKTVIVCLGNPYMKDDAIALKAAGRLREKHLEDRAFVIERHSIDLALLWQFRSAKKVIVVDALESGDSPGTVSLFSIKPRDGPLLELPNLHGLELHDAFDLSQSGILPIPIVVVGVEPKDCGAGEGLSEELTAALPRVVAAVMEELGLPEE